MTTRVGYFPQNNTLWVARHRDLLPGVEWVDLNALGRGAPVDPTRALPSAHSDHLFDGGYDFIGTGSTPRSPPRPRGTTSCTWRSRSHGSRTAAWWCGTTRRSAPWRS
ncbi:hypothetical protein ACFQYP_12540 [Nonomuraea antimicrobica]